MAKSLLTAILFIITQAFSQDSAIFDNTKWTWKKYSVDDEEVDSLIFMKDGRFKYYRYEPFTYYTIGIYSFDGKILYFGEIDYKSENNIKDFILRKFKLIYKKGRLYRPNHKDSMDKLSSVGIHIDSDEELSYYRKVEN